MFLGLSFFCYSKIITFKTIILVDIQVVSIPALYSWQQQSKIFLWILILLVELFLLEISMNELTGSHITSIFSVLVQESGSVSRSSCPTLCDPMDCSMPGLPVYCGLPEFTQTHVHWVGDAIQPSHPLSSLSPPVFHRNVSISLPEAVVVRVCVCM